MPVEQSSTVVQPDSVAQPNRALQLFDSPGGRWLQDFATTYASGAVMDYSGRALKHVPGMKWAGNTLESWGKFNRLYAAPDATIGSINRAAGWDTKTPTTPVEHAKKWIRSVGTEAALGTALMGAGLAISAIPHPATMVGGRALAALARVGPWLTTVGKGVRNYSILNASFGTAADMLGNYALTQQAKKEQQQQRMQEMQAKYQTDAQRMNWLGAGIAGVAGLGGAHLLVSVIPALKRRRYLKYLAYLAAAGGAGYAGWKYTQNQNNKYQMV